MAGSQPADAHTVSHNTITRGYLSPPLPIVLSELDGLSKGAELEKRNGAKVTTGAK